MKPPSPLRKTVKRIVKPKQAEPESDEEDDDDDKDHERKKIKLEKYWTCFLKLTILHSHCLLFEKNILIKCTHFYSCAHHDLQYVVSIKYSYSAISFVQLKRLQNTLVYGY